MTLTITLQVLAPDAGLRLRIPDSGSPGPVALHEQIAQTVLVATRTAVRALYYGGIHVEVRLLGAQGGQGEGEGPA